MKWRPALSCITLLFVAVGLFRVNTAVVPHDTHVVLMAAGFASGLLAVAIFAFAPDKS